MANNLFVVLEYAQAFMVLIYYWFRTLFVTLFVRTAPKSVENEIVLITGAGWINLMLAPWCDRDFDPVFIFV